MILAVDIGNTETVIGLFDDLDPVRTWRLATDPKRTADEIALTLSGLLAAADVDGYESPERLVIASVVPVLNRSWAGAGDRLGAGTEFLTGTSPIPIRLDVERPAEVGADRIANTLAAATLFEANTIVVDLGTATTFDCISAEGVFLGGVIAPGPLALDQLTRATAQLPKVELSAPSRVIGRNTLDCLRSGGFYTVVDGIDGIVRRILDEWEPEAPMVAATGGLAEVVGRHCRTVERIEPALTITGLAIADRYLSGEVTL
ncbi:MAG: type III pantothenate kinase [Gemmatimonadota bacterium]|nr:type III pantothenate kinase [Gemmatimonadota bacterium]